MDRPSFSPSRNQVNYPKRSCLGQANLAVTTSARHSAAEMAMNPSIIDPDYMVRVTRLYGLTPDTVARLIMHFLMGTSLWLISTETKVDLGVIKRLFRSAWRRALRIDRGAWLLPGGTRDTPAPANKSASLTLDHLTVLADMHRMNADEGAIRTYLSLIGITWDAAHEALDDDAAQSATVAQRSALPIAPSLSRVPRTKPAGRSAYQRRSGRDYYLQAVDVNGLSTATAEKVLRYFAQSTPMATVSAETGVDINVLNRLYSFPWWNAIVPVDHLSAPRPASVSKSAPQKGTSRSLRALIHELKALHLPAKVIRSYLQIDATTWKQIGQLLEGPDD